MKDEPNKEEGGRMKSEHPVRPPDLRERLSNNAVRVILLLLSSFGLLLSSFSFAGMPQPMVVYYGQAKDGYGWPYRSGADVVLLSDTNEIGLYSINGSLTPGVNFMLQVPMDDGRDTNRYVRNAVHTGEVVSIVIRDSYGQQTIMESNAVPAIPASGELVLVNVTAGTDSDGDGLPDAWEWELIRWADDPAYSTLADIRPGDDFDGDGQPNDDEYHAGTFAFLNYDFFYAEIFNKAVNGRWYIEVLSVPGKVYRLESAPIEVISGGYNWQSHAYARTLDGAWEEGPVEGTGDWITFFLPPPDTNRVWRLKVQ